MGPADPPQARIAPPALLRAGAPAAVLAALPGARAVGGCVRDILAGRPVADVDVAAPLPPEAIAARLRDAGLKVFETGIAHGTVTAVLGRQPVEVTALRRDLATDGRHAEVEWTTDWREDAARRDFTINAMSLSAEGALWDYFGGREDLRRGLVRFVGDPATRLAEDYLRALRFFRFQARYGTGAPDPAAVAAIRGAVPGLARLSAERVWSELKRLLATPDPLGALALMRGTGVLGAVLPEAGAPDRLAALLRLGAPAEPLLRLAALLPRDAPGRAGASPPAAAPAMAGALPPSGAAAMAAALARRLRFANEERDVLLALAAPPALAPDLDDAALRRLLAEAPAGRLVAASWLAEADDPAAADPAAMRGWSALRDRLRDTPRPVFPLQGRDVLAMGVAAGPRVGALLSATRRWWLAGGCVADAEACRVELARRATMEGPP
ncbi:CCA tRNA nucleotidyltransferase [Roseomonas sp. NAR14]|uniref:CCA tRNA nucleotidyltransferase n=2 Tax=Roseomonas acroporae TaxID=2937791 RepID=A0A9X1YEU3_9PROT|nr:CCA tRNA nucleotidyltransferase [Roseomonas acroporae]MCK8787805.1 CCA tRNA nucleotidyltransferase [Roseomonas acroporae]